MAHRLFIGITIGLLFNSWFINESSAKDVLLYWDSVTNHPIAFYKVYYREYPFSLPFNGTGAVQGNSPINVGNNTTSVLNGLNNNTTHYIATTSYSSYGIESSFSEIIEISPTNTISNILSLADSNISTALDRLPSGNSLKIMALTMEYNEDVIINRCNDSITLSGGYNSSYSILSGVTVINGSLTVICGKVLLDNLVIK